MNQPIPGPRGRRLNRRGFLKLGAFAGLAAALRVPDLGLRIASALPLSGYPVVSFAGWPQRPPPGFDLLRVPAYLAAAYIRSGSALSLDGPRGRPHDPEGAFTVPARYLVGALLGEGPAPSWETLWAQPAGAAWPNSARLVIAAALLRRGYSPNDTHPGHLAQAEADLLAAGRPTAAPTERVIYALEQLADLDPAALPAGGTPLVEYDWVIPADSTQPDAARKYVAEQPLVELPAGPFAVPLIPLMPLPERALAQHAAMWARLRWLPAG